MTEATEIVKKQDASQSTGASQVNLHPPQTATKEVIKLQQEAPAETSATDPKETLSQAETTAVSAAEPTTTNAIPETKKKRKLSDASTTNKASKPNSEPSLQAQQKQQAPQTQQQQTRQQTPPPQTHQHSFDLEDYSIIPQTVRDLLTLLQLYGALTAGQLEYNLPVNNSPSLIQDVLEVLVCIGLVQKVLEEDENKVPRYCVSRGVPRADPVNLPVLQHEIFAAHRQANRSLERTKLLQAALTQDESNPKEVLQRLLHEYPEIQQDPVYMTALRQCHVDASTSGEKIRKKTTANSTNAKQRKSTAKEEAKGVVAKEVTPKVPPTDPPTDPPTEPTNPLNEPKKPSAEAKALNLPEETKVEAIDETPKPITATSDGVTQ